MIFTEHDIELQRKFVTSKNAAPRINCPFLERKLLKLYLQLQRASNRTTEVFKSFTVTQLDF